MAKLTCKTTGSPPRDTRYNCITGFLCTMPCYEQWNSPQLSEHWLRWVRDADTQEVMSVAAAALLRLSNEP